jgi:hypothetical protein
MRRCSDGFEIGCDKGERIRITFTLDCCDREAGDPRRGKKPGMGASRARAIDFGIPGPLVTPEPIWRRPSLPSRQRSRSFGRIGDLRAPNSGRERDSLMRAETSLIANLNSLQGLKKFPVRMRRELARRALI